MKKLRNAVVEHLQKNQCMEYFERIPPHGQEDKHTRQHEIIVHATLDAIKAEDFGIMIELEHIIDKGAEWERQHRKRQATLTDKGESEDLLRLHFPILVDGRC